MGKRTDIRSAACKALLRGTWMEDASRRLRRESLVPAIIYGGNAEPVAVTLELRELVKALESNAFFEEVVEIKVGDKVENVKIQALQRHPAKNTPMHADFKRA